MAKRPVSSSHIALLNALSDRTALKLGFTLPVEVPGLFDRTRVDFVRCFSRAGTRFKSAALCFSGILRPRRAFSVDFFASPFTLAELAGLGLDRNAMLISLAQLQLDFLERPFNAVLPQRIDLGEPQSWDSAFLKVEAELAFAEPLAWDALWGIWSRAAAQQRDYS